MPKLDRYILAQLVVLFGFFSLVLVSVYWINRAVGLFEELIGGGQSALVFLEFTALALPNVIRLVLPISAFAATVYVINRLSTESELVVAQAMGVSVFRLARPVILFGVFVAVLVSLLNHILVPASRSELKSRSAEISQDLAAQILVEGQFIHPVKGVTVFIGEITPQGELINMLLTDQRSVGQRITYTAQRALLLNDEDGPKLAMFDGMAQVLRLQEGTLSTTRYKDFVYDIGGMISEPNQSRRKIEELSTPELLRADEALLDETGKSRAEFLYEGHARISQPLLAIAASLIGLAALLVGGYSRFGVGKQILFALALLVGLQLLDNAMADLARSDAILWPVVYIPPTAGSVVAVLLLFWAMNPGLAKRLKGARA